MNLLRTLGVFVALSRAAAIVVLSCEQPVARPLTVRDDRWMLERSLARYGVEALGNGPDSPHDLHLVSHAPCARE
jgi:hypothetical protein